MGVNGDNKQINIEHVEHSFLGNIYSLNIHKIHTSYILMIPSRMDKKKKGKQSCLLLLSKSEKCVPGQGKKKCGVLSQCECS